MATIHHKRTTVASMFHNDISQNTKCAVKDSFHSDKKLSFVHTCQYFKKYCFEIFNQRNKPHLGIGHICLAE